MEAGGLRGTAVHEPRPVARKRARLLVSGRGLAAHGRGHGRAGVGRVASQPVVEGVGSGAAKAVERIEEDTGVEGVGHFTSGGLVVALWC